MIAEVECAESLASAISPVGSSGLRVMAMKALLHSEARPYKCVYRRRQAYRLVIGEAMAGIFNQLVLQLRVQSVQLLCHLRGKDAFAA